MKYLIFLIFSIIFLSCKGLKSDEIKIGNQTWKNKNLDVSRYNNGDEIPQVTDAEEWANMTSGAWCWYDNDSANFALKYGKLYNWYAINDSRGLAPVGWHIPTEYDLLNMISILGGKDIAGSKLKESGITNWTPTNSFSTNEFGFTSLPGGMRGINSSFMYLGQFGIYWSSTQVDQLESLTLNMGYNSTKVGLIKNLKHYGFSVRLIKGK